MASPARGGIPSRSSPTPTATRLPSYRVGTSRSTARAARSDVVAGWPGAGRKKSSTRVPYGCRPVLKSRYPVHVTLRVSEGCASLRRKKEFAVVTRSIGLAHKDAFRVVHFAVLGNHLHFIVEGGD